MARAQNVDTTAPTPLAELNEKLKNLPQGDKIFCPNTKEEILRTQQNLTRKRAEITGADSHIQYIEALLIAEANGQLTFKPA